MNYVVWCRVVWSPDDHCTSRPVSSTAVIAPLQGCKLTRRCFIKLIVTCILSCITLTYPSLLWPSFSFCSRPLFFSSLLVLSVLLFFSSSLFYLSSSLHFLPLLFSSCLPLLLQSMLAVDISETNSRLSLALADQKIFEGEVALNSKRSVVSASTVISLSIFLFVCYLVSLDDLQ